MTASGGRRPTWLFDVDGSINVVRNRWSQATHSGDVQCSRSKVTYRLHWAPALMQRIRAIQRAGAADLVLCSSWCPEAAELERRWLLAPLGRAFDEHPPCHEDVWGLKVAAGEQVIAHGWPLIWTDDELPTSGELYERFTAAGALLITPLAGQGLGPDHMDQIDAFIAANGGTW